MVNDVSEPMEEGTVETKLFAFIVIATRFKRFCNGGIVPPNEFVARNSLVSEVIALRQVGIVPVKEF